MASTVGRNIAAPLLFLNFAMYIVVVGFAGWNLNKFINGQTHYPGIFPPLNFKSGREWCNHMYFLIFSILAGVLGVASKFPGANHLRAWRNDSLAAAGSSALVAWAVTALALGLACKEIDIGGHRGWRLKVLEGFIIVLGATELVYVLLLHAGIFSSKYGPGYRDTEYGAEADPAKGGGATAAV